jgi:hypothetical protein
MAAEIAREVHAHPKLKAAEKRQVASRLRTFLKYAVAIGAGGAAMYYLGPSGGGLSSTIQKIKPAEGAADSKLATLRTQISSLLGTVQTQARKARGHVNTQGGRAFGWAAQQAGRARGAGSRAAAQASEVGAAFKRGTKDFRLGAESYLVKLLHPNTKATLRNYPQSKNPANFSDYRS